VNLSELGRDLGVALNTVKAWLSVLEATFQVTVLRPYHANVGKRLVKTPKIYFTDVGTLCYLTGLKDPDHAASGPLAGAIFETAVLAEIVKALIHRGVDPQVYFWRTSAGTEVDFLVAHEGQLVPVEVKATATPRPAMASSIRGLQRDLGGISQLRASWCTPGRCACPWGRGCRPFRSPACDEAQKAGPRSQELPRPEGFLANG